MGNGLASPRSLHIPHTTIPNSAPGHIRSNRTKAAIVIAASSTVEQSQAPPTSHQYTIQSQLFGDSIPWTISPIHQITQNPYFHSLHACVGGNEKKKVKEQVADNIIDERERLVRDSESGAWQAGSVEMMLASSDKGGGENTVRRLLTFHAWVQQV